MDQENTFAKLRNAIMQNSTVCVFDFDGVIADTEPLHQQAYQELLPKSVQFDFTQYIGHSEEKIYKKLNTDLDIALSLERDKPRRLEIFLDLVVRENLALSRLTTELLPMAPKAYILSSQDQYVVETLLKQWQIIDHFLPLPEECTDLDKEQTLKRLPDLLKVEPQKIFHFEDSLEIAKLSHSLGHTVVYVKHSLNQDPPAQIPWVVQLD